MSLGHIDRFELIRELGKSNHETVYKAVDPANERTVAIRRIAPESPNLEKLREKLRRARALESPNIVRVLQTVDAEQACCAVMEYAEGNTLRSLLAGNSETGWDILDVARQLCSAIDHARSRQFAHTNFTPANIMVEWDGNIKVLDYGLLTDPGESAQAGRNADALHYMSPEQVKGEEPTWRSNLFSLGVILYEMVAGVKPFSGGDVGTLLENISTAKPAPPHSISTKVAPRVSAAILKALAKSPDERYASGAELVRALETREPAAPPAPVVATPRQMASAPVPPAPSHQSRPERQPPVRLEQKPAPLASATLPPAPVAATHKVVVQAPLSAASASPPTRPATPVAAPPPPAAVCAAAPVSNAANTAAAETAPPATPRPSAPAEASQQFLVVGARPARPVAPVPNRAAGNPWLGLLKLRYVVLCGAAALLVLATALVSSYAVRSSDASAPKIQEQPPSQPVVKEDVAAPPEDTEPEVRVVLAPRARKRVSAAPAPVVPVITTGELMIDSSPRGAMVELDGQNQAGAVTPYTAVNISAGRHIVTLRKEGYAAESQAVDITAGQKAYAVVSLKELGARVAISSDPEGATVLIDGRDAGKTTPMTVILPPGKHTVSFQKYGFLQSVQTVELVPGQALLVRPRLLPTGNTAEIKPVGKFGRMFGRGAAANMGTIRIRTNPKGAQIMINERLLDKTAPAELAAPAGSYEITLIYPGYRRLRRTIAVVAGSTTAVDESLQP